MTISEINIYPVRPNNGLVGFVSFLYDGCLSVNSVAIHDDIKNGGYRLVYPSKVLKSGRTVTEVYPINSETEKQIKDAVVEKFNALMSRKRGG